MQTKNVNVNQDPQPSDEATPDSSSQDTPKAPGSPAPPLPPRLSAPIRSPPHQYGSPSGPAGAGSASNDPTVYSAYKPVPTPRPYPPPYRMPPVPVPPPPVYNKYGSEPILPGTMASENNSPHLFSAKFPSPIRRDIDLTQGNWGGQDADSAPPRIPTLADLTRGQPQRPRTAHAAIAPEPGPPPPRSQVWVDEKAARNIPVQQRLRTLLNHSPVDDSDKGRTKTKALEGEPLLPCSRRAVSYPEGISNPGLEDGEGYVPSQPHQRKEGSRGQVLLDRQPKKIPLHESNPNINYHPPVSTTTSAESTDTNDGSGRAPSVNTVWSTGTLSEDGHSSKLRDTYLRLYPTAGRIGQPSWMPLGPNRKEDGQPHFTANHAHMMESGPTNQAGQASQQYYYLRDVAGGKHEARPEQLEMKVHTIQGNHPGSGDHAPKERLGMHHNSAEYTGSHHSLLPNCVGHPVTNSAVHPHERDIPVSSSEIQPTSTENKPMSHHNGTDQNAQQQLFQGRKLENENLYQKLSSLNPNYYQETVQLTDKNLYNSANQKEGCGEKKWSVNDELSCSVPCSGAPVPVLPSSSHKTTHNGVNSDSAQSGQQSSGSSDYERNTHTGLQSQATVTTASESGRGTMPGTPSLKSGSLSGTLDSSLESDINTYHTRTKPPEWRDSATNDMCDRKNPAIGIVQHGGDAISDTLSLSPPLPPLSPTQSNSDSSVMSPKYSKYKLSVSAPSLNKSGHMVSDHHMKPIGGWQHPNKKLGSHHVGPDSMRSYASRHHPSSKSQSSGSSHSRSKALRVPIVLNPSLSNIHEAGDGEITSTTTGLDMESLLDDVTASSLSSDQGSSHDESEVHDLRRQLEGLETMYSEVLKMIGMTSRGGVPRSLAEVKPKRKVHGSLSSLTGKGYSSSTSKGHTFKDRRYSQDKRKPREGRGTGRRFQRLESHVVTLARSVAHLSSEMRTQHVMFQEIESLRREIGQLRDQQMALRMNASSNAGARTRGGGLSEWENFRSSIPSLTNPTRIKKLAKFFGAEPPLLRLFLKKLGYERYASNFEAEKIGMIELPYLTEERLQKIGIPMGPRMRILQEAQMSFRQEHFSIYIV